MENMLRRFGIRKVEQRETDARQKLQKELFCYQKCADYGFPNKASCLAYNEELNLLAIGTKDGCIKIYGAPGIQFTAEHEFDVSVQEIFFFGKQGTVVTYCSDDKLSFWTVIGGEFREEGRIRTDDKFRKATSFCLSRDHARLYIGSDDGHVRIVGLKRFKFEKVLQQMDIMSGCPPETPLNVGDVKSIQEHPIHSSLILIGYSRGLIILYDTADQTNSKHFNNNQQLEYLVFSDDGDQFVSCHTNGSYSVWNVLDPDKPNESVTPYGPFPCKTITKFSWKPSNKRGEPMMIFSGGMPNASYGDRHAVTVMCSNRHVTYDLSSKVIDFVVLSGDWTESERCSRGYYGDASVYSDFHSLLILTEEELVGVDLTTNDWPVLQAPYMAAMHASAITCSTQVGGVSPVFYKELVRVGGRQRKSKVSMKPWPITGGTNMRGDASDVHDLLITGHEDGSVRMWDVSTTDVKLLLKLETSELFEASFSRAEGLGDFRDDDDDEWPPFRKVGSYDPYVDDLRLAVRKLELCKDKKTLVIAGTAGQLIVLKFKDSEMTYEEFDLDFRPVKLNIVDERSNFAWKGHEPLTLRKGHFKMEAGFQPVCIAQAFPPATCTSLAFNTEWELAAIGTAHGFGLVDYKSKKFVEVKCTLNQTDLFGAGEGGVSRRKSFKKSLRESFRRLRSRRSERHKKTTLGVKSEEERSRQISNPRTTITPTSLKNPNMSTTVIDLDVPKPVERAVEARSASDSEGSIVRTLYFADTFLLSGHTHTPTFWGGTNLGTVFIYQLSIPEQSKRTEEEVQGTLAKEVHLRHRAPVMNICVVDKNMTPLSGRDDLTEVKTPDMSPGHSVIICSEEQIKIFSLPSLSAKEKFKLTANEGSKIRKAGYANFVSKSDPKHNETCLMCLTNQGDVNIFSIPSLRRQLKADCIRKDNIQGIVSCIFTPFGEGFFMDSPSEFSRFSLSTKVATRPDCRIENSTRVVDPPGNSLLN